MRTLSFLAAAGTAALLASCSGASAPSPPFRPVANVDQLMDAVITPAALTYWGAVSIIVDADGVTENVPDTEEEWEAVWAAGITLAESGNLLMMAPRAVDQEQWMLIAADLIDIGVEAAAAAEAKDAEAVLEIGERIYLVCLACHDRYIDDDAP
jgi:hypothetical protein